MGIKCVTALWHSPKNPSRNRCPTTWMCLRSLVIGLCVDKGLSQPGKSRHERPQHTSEKGGVVSITGVLRVAETPGLEAQGIGG